MVRFEHMLDAEPERSCAEGATYFVMSRGVGENTGGQSRSVATTIALEGEAARDDARESENVIFDITCRNLQNSVGVRRRLRPPVLGKRRVHLALSTCCSSLTNKRIVFS